MSHLYRDRPVSGAFLPERKTCTFGRACRSRRRLRSLQSGFTLIEVVIALAIFVIGAVAIVRIFTPALGVIQNSGNQTVAMRGAQSMLARTSSTALGAPDWIYNYDSANGARYNEAYIFNGTINKNESLPRNPFDLTATALGNYKYIEGERQKVLFNNDTGVTNVNLKKFVMTNFPYEGRVAVSVEDKITGVRVDDRGYLSFADAVRSSTGGAWVDADNVSPPPSAATYYISYSWIDNADHMRGVVDEAYRFNTLFSDFSTPEVAMVLQGRRRDSVSTANVNRPKRIVPGEVSVRMVLPLGTTPLAPAVAEDDFRGIASVGGFSSLKTGDTVYLSYEVKDWRWMVDDGVPGVTPEVTPTPVAPNVARSVTLPIRGLGDPAVSSWAYTALIPPNANSTVNAVYRDKWDGANVIIGGDVGSGGGGKLFDINDKSGQVTYAYNPAASYPSTSTPIFISAPRTRTVYRTLDGWAQQVSVAARSYVPYINNDYMTTAGSDIGGRPGNAPLQPWREYYWDGPGADQIYFRSSEAGKTIMVTYEDTSGVSKSEVLTIDDDVNPPPTLPSSNKPFGGLPGVPNVSMTTLSVAANGIISIQGLSVQARTAWIDGGRYSQTVATSYRK